MYNNNKMLAQICLQFILVFISSLIPLILSQCSHEVINCFNKFSTNLETHKKHQFLNIDNQLNDICDQTNGYYFKFVECVTSAEQLCSTDPNYRQYLCETRRFKMRITRFNWKPTFFHNICHNISSDLSQGFFKHEECISNVMNGRNWKCDVNYDKPIKAYKVWKSNLNTTCSLWRKFRDCSKNDIKHKCGTDASNISDQLFHSHQSYFEKYNSCELEGQPMDRCWYDVLKAPITQPSVTLTTMSSTEVTLDPTTASMNDILNPLSHKEFDLLSSYDNSSHTQSLQMKTHMNETNDLSDEESNQNTDQWITTDNISVTNDIKLNDKTFLSDNTNEENFFETNEVNESIHKNTQLLTYSSGATTDSYSYKCLLIIPLTLILYIKCFA